MKQTTILLVVLLLGCISLNSQAQIKIPKSVGGVDIPTEATNDVIANELVKALKPSSALGLGADQLSKLEKNNKSYVNDLLGIFGGSGTSAAMEALAGKKQKERKDFVENLLGESKAAKYYSLIKPQVQPLITKYAMAKFLL